MYKRVDLALAALLAVLGVAVIVIARATITSLAIIRDPIGPRGFAYVIGAFCAVGGAVLVWSQLRRWRRTGSAAAEAETGGDEPGHPASAVTATVIMAASLVYVLLLSPVGFLLATPPYAAGCLWAMGTRNRWHLIAFPLGYTVLTWLIFDVGLGVRLPHGIYTPLLELAGLA